MYQPPVPEIVWGGRDQSGRRREGAFMEELGLEMPPLVVRPTIEVTIHGALTLFQAL